MFKPAYPHRNVAFLAMFMLFLTIPLSAFVVIGTITVRGTKSHAADATIDISTEAVQKVHVNGVPHTDINGTFKSTYDSNSFLPIGIYNPTLCQVTKTLSWTAVAGYSGEYRIQVNYGSSRGAGTYLLADINIGTGSVNQTVGNLPASSALHYAILRNDNKSVVVEGNFTSDACTNTAEDNNLQSLKNAGFNSAIVEKNVYPDANYLAKSQESGVKLLLDMRDRPNDTFSNLKDNANVIGFYVGDDDLARARAANTDSDPGNNLDVNSVYASLQNYAQSLDSQTTKTVLAAEPDVEASAGPTWLNWYNQFDAVGNVSFHYNYPKSSIPFIPWQSIKTVADTVKHQVAVNGDARPSWFISQAINLKWVIPLEFPTASESRAMIYAAIVHGATGIFDFSYDGWFRRQPKGNPAPQNQNDINWWDRHAGVKALPPVSYPGGDKWAYSAEPADQMNSAALWNGLDASQNGVNKQITDLKPIILSPTVSDDYKVFVDSQPYSQAPIRTILKKNGNDYYLFAVNIDKAPINVKLELTGKNFQSAQVMFEGRNANLVGGNILSDSFAEFGVHVYKLVSPTVLPLGKFRAQYFDSPDFTNKVLEREEDKAKLGGSLSTTPVPELTNDNSYSVRWEGNFDFAAGKYRFNANPSVDSIKVYVDDSLLVEGTAQQNALVDVTSGVHKLKLEYVRSRSDRNFSLLTNYVNALSCYDMTGDFKINSADQLALVAHFGATGDTPWDLTGDGRVNSGDQLLLAQNFGNICP